MTLAFHSLTLLIHAYMHCSKSSSSLFGAFLSTLWDGRRQSSAVPLQIYKQTCLNSDTHTPVAPTLWMSEYRQNRHVREKRGDREAKKWWSRERKDRRRWRGVGRRWLVRERQWVGETKTLWGWERCWICDGRDFESFFWYHMSAHVNTWMIWDLMDIISKSRVMAVVGV